MTLYFAIEATCVGEEILKREVTPEMAGVDSNALNLLPLTVTEPSGWVIDPARRDAESGVIRYAPG